MKSLQAIELFAGLRPDGQPMVERLQVRELADNRLQLVSSPAFVKGIAAGDIVRCDSDKREFEILEHSGNLSVRVYCKSGAEQLAETLNGPVAQLGGELDVETPRLLVYTLHVSCGFKEIEALFSVANTEHSAWQYGNVYDPEDGITPLNWWQNLSQPE